MLVRDLFSYYLKNNFNVKIYNNKTGEQYNENENISELKQKEDFLLEQNVLYFNVKEQKDGDLMEILIIENEVN